MDQLALLGGEKAVALDYEKFGNRPCVTQKGIDGAIELMKKGMISQSPTVNAFERRFAKFIGADYALAMCNGTSALDTALFALGVALGDEVLVPSYTFWATVAPIVAQYAVPVFCDVDPETYCIDPRDMERKITPRTKAIMCVHVWGNPCDMDAIMGLAKKYNLAVIEDCSHAHGASYKGKKVGTIGDIGCFSMQGSKLLCAGEGGVLVTNRREFWERSVALGHYDRIADLPEDSAYRQYVLTGMGHKYRANPLAIAIADANLEELEDRNLIRNHNAVALETALSDLDFLEPQRITEGADREYAYQYMRFKPERLEGISTFVLLKALAAEGVICGYCGYGRLHNAPLFAQGGAYGNCGPHQQPVSLPVTERLAEETFMIAPRFENECPQLIAQYAQAYHKVAENGRALKKYEAEHDFTLERKNLSGRSVALFK